MKIPIIVIFTLFGLNLFGQIKPYKIKTYEKDSLGEIIQVSTIFTKESSDYYYKEAIKLVYNNDTDSLKQAYYMLRDLNYFDSLKYSNLKINKYYAQIESNLLLYNKKTIIGSWNFEWSGSNWGTSKTLKDKKAKIIFTDTECFFYVSDTLQRQTKYKITNEYSYPYPKVIFFQLYFYDTKNYWNFSFWEENADYNAKLKFDKENIGLFINEMPNCLCGCPESIYIKHKLVLKN